MSPAAPRGPSPLGDHRSCRGGDFLDVDPRSGGDRSLKYGSVDTGRAPGIRMLDLERDAWWPTANTARSPSETRTRPWGLPRLITNATNYERDLHVTTQCLIARDVSFIASAGSRQAFVDAARAALDPSAG
jgi:hypothetical protein